MPLPEPVPDLRSLDLLRSVAELGSIRQAALAHGVTQPAASTRLRSLERVLGLTLLDRSRGKARLTDEGLAVVQWSEELLDRARDLLVAVEAARAEGRTHLRLMASMTVAEYLMPEWLHRLRHSDPEIAVSLQMGNTESVLNAMRANVADPVFTAGSQDAQEPASRVVRAVDPVAVAAPPHPTAKRRRPFE